MSQSPETPIFNSRQDGGTNHLDGESSRCFLSGEQTGGLFSLTESVLDPGADQAPLHVHSREDETFYVLEGRVTAAVGDQSRELSAGDSVWLPRGVPHRIRVEGQEPARILMLLTPAGLEKFFAEVDAMHVAGDLDPAAMAEAAARYGVTILGRGE